MLTHRVPYPPDKGERIRSYHWLRYLSRRCSVDLLSLDDTPAGMQDVSPLEQYADNVQVVQIAAPLVGWRYAQSLLTGRSMTEGYFYQNEFDRIVSRALSDGGYDACVAACSTMGSYVLRHGFSGRFVVDLVDADSAKWQIYASHTSGIKRSIFRREYKKIAALERRLIDRADATVVVGPEERSILEGECGTGSVHVITNGVDTEYFRPACAKEQVHHLLFVGQMDYTPNVDAVTWFAEHVWPTICQKYPLLQWYIVGRNPSATVRRLADMTNVVVTGGVDDVRDYMSRAISVIPVRIGCGLQNKILESMASGLATVTTARACAGAGLRAQEEVLVANEPAEWISAIDLLMQDSSVRSTISSVARAAVEQRFQWDTHGSMMAELVCTGATTSWRRHEDSPAMATNT